jgi:hypothetical protein
MQAARRAWRHSGHGSLRARLAPVATPATVLQDAARHTLIGRCAIPPAAARRPTATLGSFVGYRARASRLPPRFAVSQDERKVKGHSRSGGNGLRPFHITPHSAKSARSLRAVRSVPWADRCGCAFAPCGFAQRGVMSCAPARLPSHHVRLDGAGLWSVLRHSRLRRSRPRAAVSQSTATQPQHLPPNPRPRPAGAAIPACQS